MNLSASLGLRCAWVGTAARAEMQPVPVIESSTRANATRHSLNGYSKTRIGMELLLWAMGRKDLPTTDDIAARYGVCRATAYRWRACLREACRLPAGCGAESLQADGAG